MPINTVRRMQLMKLIPEGVPVTRHFLREKGFSKHALDNIVKSRHLALLASGVYTKPDIFLTWQGVVCCLQHVMKTDLVVGGLTALGLHGMAHYIPLGKKKRIDLYGTSPLPQWVRVLENINFERHSTKELLGRGVQNNDTALMEFTSAFTWKEGTWPMRISSPERAYLELLAGMPKSIDFEHADQLMQGMTALVPERMQKILETCQNRKARRLFFWFAERYDHAWLKILKPEKIDLGAGKRQIAEHGKLDQKYQITVPESMWTGTASSSSKSNF